jgi:hypothetical protein
MLVSTQLLIAVLVCTLCGCTSNQAKQVSNPPGIHSSVDPKSAAARAATIIVEDYYLALDRARSETDPKKKAAYVADFVDNGIALVSTHCSRWFEQIYSVQREIAFRDGNVSVLSQLGTTLLGVAKTSSSVVSTYGALNTAYAGMSENMQTQYLITPTSKNVEEHIRTLLGQGEADLRSSLSNTTTFAKAYSQLEAYGRICTYETAKKVVDGALQATKSQVDPNSGAITTIASFQSDDFTRRLRTYWKPDGNAINPENEARIKNWMQSNGIQPSITFFLKTDHFADARKRAAADLGLIEK